MAVAELSTRNLISGTTRLMSAFACVLQLTFGIEAGIKVWLAATRRPQGNLSLGILRTNTYQFFSRCFSIFLHIFFKTGGVMFSPKSGPATSPLPTYWNFVATVVASFSFAVLLRVPPKQVCYRSMVE